MPAFRLVGAQVRTVKAEMSKPRPKGSPRILPEQTYFRQQAKRFYDAACAHYLLAEGAVLGRTSEYAEEDIRDLLRDANLFAIRAQQDWRRVQPSDDVALTVVTFEDRRSIPCPHRQHIPVRQDRSSCTPVTL